MARRDFPIFSRPCLTGTTGGATVFRCVAIVAIVSLLASSNFQIAKMDKHGPFINDLASKNEDF